MVKRSGALGFFKMRQETKREITFELSPMSLTQGQSSITYALAEEDIKLK